ncbi:radical SAM protein [Oceanihabitans sp. 2_MG-2023]|uniref:B12-binding domain-containing radical SAM protein n=1 Tax=Oceanihabitans sp. 2_MG-2023 TaxID=3062661 RepID=UPI0026E40586|nr:radical SAM protein [Oceanihabitans sp. 2_MG-2023]MDO6596404.1 radical SAM protein [Oceanihabitans sp. 2_MG-2023]
MTDIVFSHSYYYKFDAKQWKNKTPFPPLGTIYAASYLRENGYSVSLFDANLLEDPKTIKPFLEKQQAKTFVLYDDGFNYLTKMCLTKMREAAFEMIKIAKNQDCKVIVCSSDATDHYEKYLAAGANFIIQGEGEVSLKELVDALSKNDDTTTIQGLVYKQNNEIVKTPKRIVTKNLDEFPLPAWDLVDIDAYKNVWKQSGSKFTLNIATTRGCPYKCNWCAKPIYGNRYNSHSPEYITKHIKYLSETYDVQRFWMCDDIFGLKPNWVQKFNIALKKEKLSISYYIQSRVDLLLKEDTIDALAESGLEEVWVGAESGSQAILDAMDKDTKVEQIYEATRLLKEKNIRVAFFIQFGYLNETREDIAKTISMIKDLIPDNIGVSVSYPLPGTKFYDMVKEDLKLKANWTDSDDLAMLFKGTYSSAFYKKLQRYVHKEYRISQGLHHLKHFHLKKYKSIFKLGFYVPSAFIDKLILKKLAK